MFIIYKLAMASIKATIEYNHWNQLSLLHDGTPKSPRGYGFLNRRLETLLPCVSDALEARGLVLTF